MRPRTLLILTALVAVLSAFIWFFERDLPSSEERAARAKKVVTLEADEVERVAIEWSEGAVVLVRVSDPEADTGGFAGHDWDLVEPLAARADSALVDSLLRRLVDLEKERTLEQVPRADVGLAAPRATVSLGTGAGETVLEIGAEIPASRNMTLAVAGREEVYVVASSIWKDLIRSPAEWRDKKLFRSSRGEIERVTLEREGQRVLLARRGALFWLEAPLVDRANEADVNALLSQITSLSAERFLGDSERTAADLGLEPASGVIEIVVTGREEPLRIELGAAESEAEDAPWFARVGADLVTLKASLDDHLARSAYDWRSRKWSASQVYKIDRAWIEDGEGTMEVRRDGGDWLRDGEKIEYGPATDLLYELTGAEAETLVASADSELGEPLVSVTLEREEGASEVLTIYQAQGDVVPVRTSHREVVLMLPISAVEEVKAKIADLRSAELAEEDEQVEVEESDDAEDS